MAGMAYTSTSLIKTTKNMSLKQNDARDENIKENQSLKVRIIELLKYADEIRDYPREADQILELLKTTLPEKKDEKGAIDEYFGIFYFGYNTAIEDIHDLLK